MLPKVLSIYALYRLRAFLQLTVIAAQSGLVMWKKKHKRSYELVRLDMLCDWSLHSASHEESNRHCLQYTMLLGANHCCCQVLPAECSALIV